MATVDDHYPWKDGDTSSHVGIERRSRLDGKVEIIPLKEAIDRLARVTQQARDKCEQILLAGCILVTAGYDYQLHEPGDPPMRPDRRDY